MKFKARSPANKSPFAKHCEEILETSQLVINDEESTMQSPRSLLSMSSNQLLRSETRRRDLKAIEKPGNLLEEGSKCFFSFNSADSEVNCFSPINKLNSSAYFTEIEACKEEIRRLKLKILNLQKSSQKASKKDNFPSVSMQEMNSKLLKQRESLEKQFKISLRQHKKKFFHDFQQEFEKLHSKLVKKLKIQQNQAIHDKKKEVEEIFSTELIIIEAEFEEKLKRKQKELETKQEIVKMLQDENKMLKDRTKTLENSAEDLKNKLKSLETQKNSQDSNQNLLNFHLLSEKCSKLEQELKVLKGSQEARLCEKCKAFIQNEQKLNLQLARLKDYLELSD